MGLGCFRGGCILGFSGSWDLGCSWDSGFCVFLGFFWVNWALRLVAGCLLPFLGNLGNFWDFGLLWVFGFWIGCWFGWV